MDASSGLISLFFSDRRIFLSPSNLKNISLIAQGNWVYDDMPFLFIHWSGSGTMAGNKVEGNPYQGYYGGMYYGTGGPGYNAGVHGEWMMSVKDDGTMDGNWAYTITTILMPWQGDGTLNGNAL